MVTACIANPFGTTTAPCPAADYVDVQQRYCSNTSTVNAWLSGCTTYTSVADVRNRRGEICIDDLAFNAGTVDVAVPVAAGDSLFSMRCDGLDNGQGQTVAQQRIGVCTTPATTFKTGCVTTGEHDEAADNTVLDVRKLLVLDCLLGGSKNPNGGPISGDCEKPIAGAGGTITVVECNRNPYLKTDNCNINDAFVALRMSRDSTCNNAGSSFNTECDIENESATQEDAAIKIRVARGQACATGVQGTRNCGDQDGNGDGTYVQAYCNEAANGGHARNNITFCPTAYETAHGDGSSDVANVALLTSKALNAEGTDSIAILPQFNTNAAHAAANFIQGDNASLNLTDGSVNLNNNALVTSGALEAPTRQTDHGFALGSSYHAPDQKLYVGLLSGTNLGAPLQNGDVDGAWSAIAQVIRGDDLQAQTEKFTLNVNFGAKTIIGTSPEVSTFGVIDINGKFTLNGVIYGTVDFADAGGATLTGLIGADGAVGIFASNNDASTAYVGGFVAQPFDPAGECAIGADPFNVLCTANNDVKLELCGGTISDLTNAGGSAAKCKAPTLSGMICGTSSDAGTNPFAPICFDTAALVDGFTEMMAMAARKTFANDCDAGNQPTGCDQPANGVVGGQSITQCANTPYDTTDTPLNCNNNSAFDGVRLVLDGKCLSGGTNPFDGDCTSSNYPNLVAQQQGYCSDPGNTWKMTCDTHKEVAGVMNARATICIANGAIDTAGGTNVADKMSLFNSACNGLVTSDNSVMQARINLAETCRDGTSAGCDQPADGISGKSVADCTKNPYDTTDSGTTTCFLNVAFNAERNDRATSRCNNAGTSFDTLCDFVDVTSNVDESIFGIVRLARGMACATDQSDKKNCGSEGDQNTYLGTYCAEVGADVAALNNVRDCPNRYATAHADVDTVVASGLRDEALNSTGTGLATVIAAGAADDTTDAPTNFIELGADGTLLTEGSEPSESPSGDTNGTGLTLMDGINGFAFARNNSNKLYVGLLHTTNLGAPLRNDTEQTATWDANLRVLFYNGSIYTPEEADFELLINYGGTNTENTLAITGGDPSLGTLGAFSIANGKFTNNGVIYGEVNFANDIAGAGTLTGLIGRSGAVGIFKSNDKTAASPTSIAYVGGFITAPAAEVDPEGDGYATFKNHYAAQSGNTELLALADSSASSTTRGFLQGTATGLIETNLTFDLVAGFNSIAVKLGGNTDNENSPDGFAVVSSNKGVYAGLLSGTDLGAPLASQSSINVEWTGSLNYVASSSATRLSTSSDFTLTVNVNDGTLTSTAISIPDFATDGTMVINGRFGNHAEAADLPPGVLGGSFALYNNGVLNQSRANEALIGLIGADGVLGVFHTSGLTGGFWASGDLPDGMEKKDGNAFDTTKPNFGAWKQAFKTAGDNNFVLPVDADVAGFTANTTYFVEGTEDGIGVTNSLPIIGGFDSISSSFTEAKNLLRLDGDANSGAFFWQGSLAIDTPPAGENRSGVGLAGLLAGTDLGAPLDNNFVSAVWSGKIRSYVFTALEAETDFHLNIAYTGSGGTVRSITAATGGTEGAVSIDANGYYTLDINGRFTDAGVLSGGVTGGGDLAGTDGTFNGLIGAKGAVGVFKDDDSNADFIGGFVVSEPAEVVVNCNAIGDAPDPFNPSCTDNDTARAEQCRDGTQGSGDCNTTPISDLVCVSSNTQYANPFADFCGTGTDERTNTGILIADVRQAVLTACPSSNSNTGVCENTATDRTELRTMTCIDTNPAVFTAECRYTEFTALQVRLCVDKVSLATGDLVNNCETNTTVTNEVCITSGVNANPFDTICNETHLPTIKQTQKTFADFCADTANPVPLGGATCSQQVKDCIANPFHGTGVGCDANVYENVRTTFCTKTDIFNAECGAIDRVADEVVTGTYAARATACVNNTAAAGIAVGLDSAACVANGAGFASWTGDDHIRDNTILDAGGAVDGNPDTNFIRGELKTDGTLNLGAGITTANAATLTLDDDDLNGFAIGSNDFGSGTKLYAGLLSTTEGVGAPYNTIVSNATWSGKLAYILGDTLIESDSFNLTVGFNGSEGTILATIGTDATGKLTLTGGFHGAGSNLIVNGNVAYLYTGTGNSVNNATAGTLTGLFGQAGAIGIFRSTHTEIDDHNFVGGFVVKSPEVASEADCSASGTPFNTNLCLNAGRVRAEVCANRNEAGATLPNGFDETTNCAEDNAIVNAICDSGLNTDLFNVFDSLCDNETFTDGLREAACRPDGSDSSNKDCPKAREKFCDNSENNIFDPLCNVGYDVARGTACGRSTNPEGLNGGCGAEGTEDTYLFDYCKTAAGDANLRHCPVAYATANPTIAGNVVAATLLTRSLNSDRTGRLEFLDAVGNDDPDVNYVEAGEDGLNLGFVEEGGLLKAGADVDQTTVRLSESAPTVDTTSGFAIARIDFADFTDNSRGNKQRYYAGILSGTDLGGSLVTTDVSLDNMTATWKTTFAVLIGNELNEFTGDLKVNFDAKTIDNGDTIASGGTGLGGIDTGSIFGNYLIIDGKFTDSGVIYGTTLLKDRNLEVIRRFGGGAGVKATGSLTGLIGKEGAVGVFSGAGTLTETQGVIVGREEDPNDPEKTVPIFERVEIETHTQYVGGFVAVNPLVTINCAEDSGNLFNVNACSAQQRATACETRNLSTPENDITNDTCNTAEILAVLCAEGGNPFDTLCADNSYDVVRGKLCTDNAYRIPTTGLAPDSTECGDQDNGYVSAYCDTPDGFGDTTNCLTNYCTTPTGRGDSGNCLVAYCGTSDGRRDSGNCPAQYCTYIDVLDANCDSTTYLAEQQMACMGQDINDPGDMRCRDVIEAACTASPFGESVSAGQFNCSLTPSYLVDDPSNPLPSVYLTARRAEIAFCTDTVNDNSGDARCQHAAILRITGACEPDPFAAACDPYVMEYQAQRDTREQICRGDAAMRADTLCNRARRVICPLDATPFAPVCSASKGKWLNQQTTLVDNCDRNSQHADCSVVVFNSLTVAGCIADPFQAACPATPFVNQRNAVCFGTATSFTAGCLESGDFRIGDAARARARLIENCSDSDNGNDDGCNTVIANGVTVASCITDPLQTECLGNVLTTTFVGLRAPLCLTPTVDSFNAGCDEDDIKGTNAARAEFCAGSPTDANCTGTPAPGSADLKYANCSNPGAGGDPYQTGCANAAFDNQRTARALACAEDAGGTGCTTIASGGLTVAGCNATPFAVGCVDNDAFIYARFKSCQDASPKPAHCSVAVGDAEGSANYVLGDDLQASAAAETGGLTLADLDENGDTTAGFAFAYFAPTKDRNGFDNFGTDKFYAGLLSTTDVGAALTTAPSNGKWAGKLSIFATANRRAENVSFVLTVDYANRNIDSSDFITALGGRLTIDGKFTDQGIIYGRTDITDGATRGAAVARGTLTGAIGAKGAVGAFVSSGETGNSFGEFAGGFVATAPAPFVPTPDNTAGVVSYADWVYGQELSSQESVSLTATTPLKNQFLGTAVDDTELDEEGAGSVTNAAKATITLAGDTDSGFAIFNNSTQYYAGLLSGTDLGAPLMDDGVSLTWMGAFRAIGTYLDSDSSRPRETGSFRRTTSFELEITFGADSRGVAGSVGSIEAFQQIARDEADNRYYLIEGTFDAGGYITGTVNLGAFVNENRTTPLADRAPNGVLTGLIGKNGVVGTFISNPIDTSVTTGEHAFRYNGGFAVAPPPPLPKYSTFVEHYGAQLPEGRDEKAGGSGFLRGLPSTLNTAGLTLDSDSSRNTVVRLGEVASDHPDYNSGFGVLRASNRYRAGLLSGTDLGALLTPDVKAEWSGKAYLIRRAGTGSGDLTLTVDFDAGTINSTTAANLDNSAGSLTVRGRFGSKWNLPDSILGGSVSYASLNAGLIGLIGDKGVLGVFHGGSDQQSAGGFWAKPDEETTTYTYKTADTLYSHWTASLTGVDDARKTRRASGVDIATLGGAESNDYITLSGSTIVLSGTNLSNGTLTQDNLMLDGSAVGGVVFGVHDYDGQSFVGLLSTTNVGGAITSGPAKAKWAGSLKGISNFGYDTLSSANFELEVTFNAGTKQGTVQTFNPFGSGQPASITGGTFNVDGEFDENGVMWGNVALNNSTIANGVFSGLIGQNGAVGAFRGADGGNGGYAGGFVVKPPSGN